MLARMSATINTYLKALDGYQATEHSHRPALKALFEAMMPEAQATNEPRRIECGAPDFVIHRKEIPFGYAETKNIGANLDDAAHRAQIKRYSDALDNLIFTDYLTFRLIREGAIVAEVCIGELRGDKIKPLPQNFDAFVDLLKSFSDYQGLTISTADELANRMAHKARMLARVIAKAIATNEGEKKDDLRAQLEVFRKHLIHEIQPAEFADIYAQTIAYGMFAARLRDPTPRTFTREQAAKLIPKANPFLRKFFQHIAGYDLDDRIVWVVDDLADLFCAADVGELMKDYGRQTERTDPFIHFYETFLGAYDPAKRKSRGVYYTPEPVVDFIVCAVDDILRNQFGLQDGIAAHNKITVPPTSQNTEPREIHKVQILDPATGTGTFLAAIVKHISEKYYANQKGAWQGYVNENLIPRLNGFELLMAAYAMAHIKLDMVLSDSGCVIDERGEERLRVFLTNALEEQHPDTDSLLAIWLSEEAEEANKIKRETPVMVVIGNPPYSGVSSNNGDWITEQIETYKYVDGKHFGERKHWLQDDYVKFIRYGQHLVDKTGEGVLAYINNHSFLDNVTFRGMRWNLLKSFDEIYTLDLHGNTRKKETAPDGSADENVFDIMQGVSINLFVKTGAKKSGELARVFHCDLYGKREGKYEFLRNKDLCDVLFNELQPVAPYYFFVPKNTQGELEYQQGFSMDELFPVNVTGIVTARDKFVIDFDKNALLKRIADFTDESKSDDHIRSKYFATKVGGKYLAGDSRGWKMADARKKIAKYKHSEMIAEYNYRPFDLRHIYYHPNMVDWGREQVMHNYIDGENVGLIFKRGDIEENAVAAFVTKHISDSRSWSRSGMQGIESNAPLYLYPDDTQKTVDGKTTREPNLDADIVKTIADTIGLRFVVEKQQDDKTFAPIDLLDYIYAVLHSPAYREKYIEFLKIDFPRVPYPTDKNQFRKLAKLGGQLRELHLLQTDLPLITEYNHSGDNTVDKVNWQLTDNKLGEVHINKNQRFEKVPATAWEFYIGGYQPAQKWLKDRKGVALTADDIRHWQKIIVALSETEKLMATIDSIQFIQ